MFRLGGPAAPPQVDPKEEINKANIAVLGNFGVFLAVIGLIRVAPKILDNLGFEI
jgi:hypothetical protein